MKENKELYKKCKKNMIKWLPSRFMYSDISLKSKLGMVRTAFFPVFMAKRGLKKSRKALKNDMME